MRGTAQQSNIFSLELNIWATPLNLKPKASPTRKKNIINPPEKWAVFPNTQEAIIDEETWHLVQKFLKTPRKKDESHGEANPLTGLVFCADCGAKMYNRRVTEGITASGNRRRASDSYDCSNHKLRALKTSVSCFNHYISTAALREIVLFTLLTEITDQEHKRLKYISSLSVSLKFLKESLPKKSLNR